MELKLRLGLDWILGIEVCELFALHVRVLVHHVGGLGRVRVRHFANYQIENSLKAN